MLNIIELILQTKVLPYISHIRHAYLAPGGEAGPPFAGGQMCLYQVHFLICLYGQISMILEICHVLYWILTFRQTSYILDWLNLVLNIFLNLNQA